MYKKHTEYQHDSSSFYNSSLEGVGGCSVIEMSKVDHKYLEIFLLHKFLLLTRLFLDFTF